VDDEDYLEVGPSGDTIDELITLFELQQGLLTAVATGGPQIKSVDAIYEQRRSRIRRGLGALGLSDPFLRSGLWK
jgi:hypothetical protein